MNTGLDQLTQRTCNLKDDFDKRMTILDKAYKQLETFEHRDNKVANLIEESCEKWSIRIKVELG